MKFKKALLIGITKSSLEEKYWKQLESSIENKIFVEKGSADIDEEIEDADCLLLAFATPITKELIDKAPNLKYIGQFSTAFGKVDAGYARSKGILVANLPGFSTECVAEFTIAVILEAIRGLEVGRQRGRKLNVDESGITAWEIKGKDFGIVGLGRIGQRVGELAKAFGANVNYWSRNKKRQSGFRYMDLDQLVANSDFLSLHAAQTPETEKIMNAKRFAALRPNCVVINTCPMELVDLDGLCARLAKKDVIFILDHADEMLKEDLKRLSAYEN